MKHILHLKTMLLIVVIGFLSFTATHAQTTNDAVLKGVLRVKFKPELSSVTKKFKNTRRGIKTGIEAFDAQSKKVSAYHIERVFPYALALEERHRKYGLDLWYELRFDEKLNPKEVAKEFSKLSEVNICEPVGKVQLIEGTQKIKPQPFGNESMPFNDVGLPQQWHYNNNGTFIEGAVKEADINLFEAWKQTTGSPDVVVAIIDGGIDVEHEDLAGTVLVNEAELNGVEGVDDDGNGYPDDIYGYNFAKNTATISPHHHGTHVAGTIGAINNNEKGVGGIAGGDGSKNSGVKMISCQIFTEDGGVGGFAKALVYAADRGAVIAQNSWGWRIHNQYDQAVLDAIDYFIAEAGNYTGSPMKGGVAIFAAGNNGSEMNIYPAAYEPCIAVAAVGPDNKRAKYSCFADWVDVSAPGGNMNLGREAGVLSTLPNDQYGFLHGTSMACPHVSGIAALVVSKFKGNITAEKLKKHLLTSVHDIDPYLPDDIKGKMGNGYIDAALALQEGDNTKVPEKVTDLKVATSQDFASLTWSVPKDEDDGKAYSYSLYWSKSEFDVTTLNYTQNTVYSAFFANVGDELQYTVNNLDASTPYYFAIKAYDRWGNESELSDIIKVATNSGPSIRLSEDITAEINVEQTPLLTEKLWVYNDSIGVLNWNAHVGFSTLEADPFVAKDNNIVYPNLSTATADGVIGFEEKLQYPKVMAPTTMSSKKTLIQSKGNNAFRIIGENNTDITNSSATRYQVTDKDGFNLTGFWIDLKWDPETGPAVVEIWEGAKIEEAKLITAQNIYSKSASVNYSRFESTAEQIFFPKNTYFWIVTHIPAGNLYPLGIAPEATETGSDNCLMSFNGGQSWKPLSEVLEDDTWTWAMSAVSQSPALHEHITLTPNSGITNGKDSLQLQIDMNAEKLIDGQYVEHVVFASNDPVNKIKKANINLKVDGHTAILKSEKTVNFGNVFAGKTKTLDIQIANEGYVGYKLGNYAHKSSNETIFYTDNKTSGTNIPARDAGWVRVTFKPTTPGVYNETITITDGKNPYTFRVFGVATAPAKIAIEPKTDTIPGNLTVGDAVDDRTFTIRNDGAYPLDYMIPKFSPNYQVEGLERPFNKFGYSYDYVIGGNYNDSKAYGWKNISSNDILPQLKDKQAFAIPVELGFSFPFRDRFYDKVWIHMEGALVFGDDGNVGLDWATGTSIDPKKLKDRDMITAVMARADINNPNASIYYAKEDGTFRVQFKYIKYGKALPNFQIVLHANGNVEVLFNKSGTADEGAKGFLVGIIDEKNEDVCFATNSDYSLNMGEKTAYHSYFRFYHPGEDMVTNATNASGILKPGESTDITLSFNTDKVLQDSIYQKLAIISNDIESPISTFTTYANVVAGGKAEMSIAKDTIDFGTVFKTAIDSLPVQIVNSGTAKQSITAIDLAGDKFSITKATPFDIGARQSGYVYVTINTNKADQLTDSLFVNTQSGERFKVILKGEVIENPIMEIAQATGINYEMPARTVKDTNLTVTNSGLSDLEIAIIPDIWYYPIAQTDNAVATSEIKDLMYVYSEGNGSGWIDITETAKKSNLKDWYPDNKIGYKAVPLNKSIPYYGQQYDTLYVGYMGWVSFIKPQKTELFTRAVGIPNQDKVPGVIAPYNAFHVPYSLSKDQKHGIYYQQDEDKVIVTWNEYIDVSGMSQIYNFQVILYNTGRIDFNYADMQMVRSHMLVGVEHPNEQQGELIYVGYPPRGKEKYSYTIFPVKKEVISASSTKKIPLRLDAMTLNDGTYRSNIVVKNNTVGNNDVLIPITLKVNGKPELVADDVVFEEQWYTEGMELKRGFKITNKGSKTILLDSARVQISDDMKVEFYHPKGGTPWRPIPEGYVPVKDFIGKKIMGSGFRPFVIADGTKLNPGDSWQFFVTYTPTEPGESSASFTIVDSEGNDALVWSTSVISKLPPVATISNESYVVKADDKTFKGTEKLIIGNVEGNNDLEWNIDVIFNRAKTKASTQKANTASASNVKTMHQKQTAPLQKTEAYSGNTQSKVKSTKADDEYHRILEYENSNDVKNWLGFGASMSFTSATKFTAPNDGFSISHIKTWYRRENAIAGAIHVEIRAGGNGIATADKVAEGKLDYSFTENDDVGEFYTVPLDKTVYIYPGEDFYVVIHYPLNVSNPQGVVYIKKEEIVKDRYFFEYSGEWYDMAVQNGFETSAYKVKALEKELVMKNWLSLDNRNGVVAKSESATILLDFNAEFAQEMRNNATLLVNTNDPNNKQFTVDVNLLINEGPVITTEMPYPNVAENETITVPFTIVDKETDTFTVTLEDQPEFVELQTSTESGTTLKASPTFTDQGIHKLVVVATDEHGAESKYPIEIEVRNVNRAPEVVKELSEKYYYQDENLESVDLNNHIVDPDKEELTFKVKATNPAIANIYTSGSQIIVEPLTPGEVDIEIVATDAEGLSVTTSFKVIVTTVTGIDDDIKANKTTVYPNPTSGPFTITLGSEINGDVELNITNMLGSVVWTKNLENVSEGYEKTVNISNLPDGTYLLSIKSDSRTIVKKIIKK